ncbi:hypothetical protein IFM89_003367 [Coptis chinensis]|uniref:peptidylprolyl isomerase n=1 Tax=Coptis chinensis TaxID=261450 RepID=A0A835IVT0_9MAGN|nr:hypothetical protein IFM89_003367 [Coptis chinensis]
MTVGGAPVGHIVMELYADVVPKTVENSVPSTTGRKGKGGVFDENFVRKHLGPEFSQWLTLGLGTNGSRFFHLIDKTAWLDGKHVMFGQVVEGMNFVNDVEKVGSQSGTCKRPVVVADCGQLS